jgi:amino acid transporter
MAGAAMHGTLGTISGVVVPTCENMWGVLIFLRFFFIVGHAGVWHTLFIVLVSYLSAFFTTMSLAAMATNGPVEAGGAYYIISRALGHKIGGAVGCTYFLGLSLTVVLEVLGRVVQGPVHTKKRGPQNFSPAKETPKQQFARGISGRRLHE